MGTFSPRRRCVQQLFKNVSTNKTSRKTGNKLLKKRIIVAVSYIGTKNKGFIKATHRYIITICVAVEQGRRWPGWAIEKISEGPLTFWNGKNGRNAALRFLWRLYAYCRQMWWDHYYLSILKFGQYGSIC